MFTTKFFKRAVVAFFYFSRFSSAISAEIPEVQKANLYHEKIDVGEYLVSEKLDGVRGRWTGKILITRNGNKINVPHWFVENFPEEELDGELWIARGKFEEVSGIIRQERANDSDWQKVRFMIFDLPKSEEVFVIRYQLMKEIVKKSSSKYLQVVEQFEVFDKESLMKKLKEVTKNGGEGLMLHKKSSYYKANRSDNLLKLKSYEDAEAIVIAYIEGNGRLKEKMGAILVENKTDGVRFKIGSGFSEIERIVPPAIGAVITYKFYGKTKNNKPRFPVFLRVRND